MIFSSKDSMVFCVKFLLITLLLFGLIIADLLTGSNDISLQQIITAIFSPDNISADLLPIIREFRLSRIIIAITAGFALSISGLLMQTIFRNPLAGPYVLGISNGASLGVAVVVLGSSLFFNSESGISNLTILFAAGLGAAAVLLLILAVSMRVKDVLSILIIGILVSGVVASIVSIMQFFANEVAVKSYVVWTMGNLDAVSFNEALLIVPICLAACLCLFFYSKKYNILLLGEQFATSMGVNVKILRIITFVGVSILTGTVTAFCGPLGFIGLAVPHIARWLFNTSNHFVLFPATVILGASFLLCGDIISHTIYNNGILPINAVISILGAPFIIWIIFKNQKTVM